MKKLIVMVMLMQVMQNSALADSGLSNHLSEKLNLANQAFNEAQAQMTGSTPVIEFKQFWLTLTATASFGVNSVLSVQVSPEITFVWEKTPND